MDPVLDSDPATAAVLDSAPALYPVPVLDLDLDPVPALDLDLDPDPDPDPVQDTYIIYRYIFIYTVNPRSSDPFYIVS